MNKNLTEIIFVLDKSGSMGSVRADTIGGYNVFIKDQKELPGQAIFTLAMFDNVNNIKKRSVLLENIEELSNETYCPNGGTALLDAVGQTINDVVSRHASLDEDEKPGKVILVVLTDGEENSSTEFKSTKDISSMIKEREKAGWEIIFLGADIDAWTTGGSMGFSKSISVNKEEMFSNMMKVSNYTAMFRSSNNTSTLERGVSDKIFNMSDDELDKQMKAYKKK